jgi:serine/threonine protein kinase
MLIVIPKYDVAEQLGAGGFGVVFRGVHKVSKRDVAIKIDKRQLHERSTESEDDVCANAGGADLLHESKVLVHLLSCSGVCRLHSFGNAMLYDGEVGKKIKYIAMDMVFPVVFGYRDPKWKHVLKELCSILESLHVKRVLHNDLKRANIMFATPYYCNQPLPKVRLIDFGLSKFLEPGDKTESVPIPAFKKIYIPFDVEYKQLALSLSGSMIGEMENWCGIGKECGAIKYSLLEYLVAKNAPRAIDITPNYAAYMALL